jgi:hypothetical protein
MDALLRGRIVTGETRRAVFSPHVNGDEGWRLGYSIKLGEIGGIPAAVRGAISAASSRALTSRGAFACGEDRHCPSHSFSALRGSFLRNHFQEEKARDRRAGA